MSNTLDDALNFTGLDGVKVHHKPCLLSDNGPCYISGKLADYLADNDDANPWSTVSPTDTGED